MGIWNTFNKDLSKKFQCLVFEISDETRFFVLLTPWSLSGLWPLRSHFRAHTFHLSPCTKMSYALFSRYSWRQGALTAKKLKIGNTHKGRCTQSMRRNFSKCQAMILKFGGVVNERWGNLTKNEFESGDREHHTAACSKTFWSRWCVLGVWRAYSTEFKDFFFSIEIIRSSTVPRAEVWKCPPIMFTFWRCVKSSFYAFIIAWCDVDQWWSIHIMQFQ